MSRLLLFLNILFIFIATTTSLAEHSSKPKPRPHTFVLPVSKRALGGQYYTKMTIGEPPLVVMLTIDVRGRAGLWFQCQKLGYNSTTYTPIQCESPKCKQYGGDCQDKCTTYLEGGVFAPLVEDNIILSYTSPSAYVAPNLTARLPLACAYPWYEMLGVDPGTNGVLGLGKSRISFVNSLVSSYKIPFRVALCLPSKPGVKHSGLVYVGGGPYLLPHNRKDVSRLLVSTPLFRNIKKSMDDAYHIDVKSIQVNGKALPLNQTLLTYNKTSKMGGATISTLISYTYLETSIYRTLVNAFALNAKEEKAVAPFTACFSSTSFGGKKTPKITFVLGGGAKWKIYRRNSLVKVSKSVVCLAFIDRVYDPIISIEIGGKMLEDRLVEFDFEASKFSFTPSLLLHNTSCSGM